MCYFLSSALVLTWYKMEALPWPPSQISSATFEQFLIRFSEFVERNEKAHGDLRAETRAENRLIKWVIGTGIAVVIALGALDLLG